MSANTRHKARPHQLVVSAGKKLSIPRDEIDGVNFLWRKLIFYNVVQNVRGQNFG